MSKLKRQKNPTPTHTHTNTYKYVNRRDIPTRGIGTRVNVSRTYPKIIQRLQALLDAWSITSHRVFWRRHLAQTVTSLFIRRFLLAGDGELDWLGIFFVVDGVAAFIPVD